MKPNMTLVGRLLQLTLWTCCWFRRQIFILVLLCLVLCHFLNVYPWTATERLMTLMKFVSRWTFSGFVWIGSIADSYIICNKYTYMIYVVSHFESNKICNQNWFVECVGDVKHPTGSMGTWYICLHEFGYFFKKRDQFVGTNVPFCWILLIF